MSLDKAVEHKKEKRKPFYKSERFDLGCRPNGGCPYCKSNRMHKHNKRKKTCEEMEKETKFETPEE